MQVFAILDLIFGLTFIYLSLSIVCSAAAELFEAFLHQRARYLSQGIKRLLGGDEPNLYKHPFIQALMRDDQKKPSYIPARTFALAVLDLAGHDAPEQFQKLDPSLQKSLTLLRASAGGDLVQFQKHIEAWYDDTMERVAGWYKRHTQVIIFILGLSFAVAFNADTFRIINLLAHDESLLSSLVAVAEQMTTSGDLAASSAGELKEAKERLQQSIEQLSLLGPLIGWADGPEATGFTTQALLSKHQDGKLGGWLAAWLLKLLGWLSTAFAVSLGAPFWFDMLNKLSMVRAALKPGMKGPDADTRKDAPPGLGRAA